MSGINPNSGGGGIIPNPPPNVSTWSSYPATTEVDMSLKKIINCADPSNPQDVATKNYVDDTGRDENLQEVLTAGNDGGGLQMVNIANPTNPQDVATKDYVDNEISSLPMPNLDDVLNSGNDGGGLQIVNIANPANPQDVATKNYVDSLPTPNLGDVLTAGNNGGGLQIVNIANPANPQDVATKNYVDSSIPSVPNIQQVLTAGTNAGALPITNLQSQFVNDFIQIDSTTGGNALVMRADSILNADPITISSDGASINGTSFFNTTSGGNGTLNTFVLNITGVNAAVTDVGTSAQMNKFNIEGGYGFSRNWMIIPAYSGGSQVSRGRIAIDKGYFATAQHPIRVPNSYDKSYYGLILSSKGEYINQPTVSEAHIYCEVSTSEKDKNVYGIYSNYDFVINNPSSEDEEDNIYSLLIPQKTPESKIGYSNSGGEGQIWVCNINGNIEKGDYICSSSICGIGMKQDDDLKHNYSIFKSAFDCNFINQNSIYPAHIIDSSNNRQWRNPDNHSEGFKYEMKTYENKVYDLVVNPNSYTINGVLTFPYDFQTNKPELVGQTFKAMLLGGVYTN